MTPLALSLAAMLAAAPAHAVDITEPHDGSRPHTLDIHAGVGLYGIGVSAGARYGIPIVSNGFVPQINNSVYINFGADLYFFGSLLGVGGGNAVGVPVALQWNFYFTEDWSAFAEAGINIFLRLDNNSVFGFGRNSIVTAVGGRYHMSDSFGLIVRLGSPYAAFGIELTF